MRRELFQPSRTANSEAKLILVAVMFALLISLQALVAFAEEPKQIQIFEVRKMLQLTSKDPIVRDYYVNAGQEMGLKEGAMVLVYRKTPLADPYKEQTQAHVDLPVGTMKIIYSDRTMAIGRMKELKSPKDSPVLDGENFMVGDRIDMRTLSFEKQVESGSASEVVKGKKTEDEDEEPAPAEAKQAPAPDKSVAKPKPEERKNASVEAPPPVAAKVEHKADAKKEVAAKAQLKAKDITVLAK
jgi:hypothetical protein